LNPLFLTRLVLDLLAAGLLLFAFSYWWLGNVAHEVAGTAMFLLLIAHNVFNRRWYGGLSKGRREARWLINMGVTFALATAMLALLITSILISNALSGVMSAYGGFTVRQIHTLAAYWVLVIVAVHLGFRWPMLMGVARNLCGIRRASTMRTVILRTVTMTIAALGVWSSFALGLGGKLSMQVSLDWWNFEESVAGFFAHCIAIAGLYIILTYYTMKWLQKRKRPTASPSAITENVRQ
jgi:Na+/proline symporter